MITFDGLPTKKKLAMLSDIGDLPYDLHNLINDLKQRFTMEIIYSKCKPLFFHQYALSKLKENNFKLVVCSNSIRNTIQVMMERSDLLGFLEFFLSFLFFVLP